MVENSPLSKHHFILASKSPRRHYLLKELGLDFEIVTKDVDESFPESLKEQEIPLFLCEKKANAFDEELKSNPNTILITADTIVWVNNHVLNKPDDKNDAVRMLKILSGNMHEVFTGVSLRSSNKKKSFYTRTKVYFKPLSDFEINNYIDTYQPFDKAGSYGAQESLPFQMNPCSTEEINFLNKLGKHSLIENSINTIQNGKSCVLIDSLEGSYFNVMGLPIKELYEELIKF